MSPLKFAAAALSATLVLSSQIFAAKPAEPATNTTKLTVESYTAGDAGFQANSHLISGPTEAILIDAQFTKPEAEAVIKLIKNSKKQLKAIFVTHGHPDHYFGLQYLAAEFSDTPIYA